jgi:hypothetical protein
MDSLSAFIDKNCIPIALPMQHTVFEIMKLYLNELARIVSLCIVSACPFKNVRDLTLKHATIIPFETYLFLTITAFLFQSSDEKIK